MTDMEVEYRGWRDGEEPVVAKFINGQRERLDPRQDLRNHSPDGPEWGYAGSGPSQLALAIMADALGDDKRAQGVYQDFKMEKIAQLDRYKPWTITQAEAICVAQQLEQKRGAHV